MAFHDPQVALLVTSRPVRSFRLPDRGAMESQVQLDLSHGRSRCPSEPGSREMGGNSSKLILVGGWTTHLKNMLVELEIFRKIGVKIKIIIVHLVHQARFPWNKGSHFPSKKLAFGGPQVMWGPYNITASIGRVRFSLWKLETNHSWHSCGKSQVERAHPSH